MKIFIIFRIKYFQIIKEKVERITRLLIIELEQRLQFGEFSVVEVCECYQVVVLEVDRKFNCVVELIWEVEVSGECGLRIYILVEFQLDFS